MLNVECDWRQNPNMDVQVKPTEDQDMGCIEYRLNREKNTQSPSESARDPSVT